MKKIVIIAQYTSIPGENGNSRFKYIIEKLIDKEKNQVELITTKFYHKTKKHRTISNDEIPNEGYKVTLLDEPGYKNNISLKRFYSHHVFAKNLKKHLENIDKPDIIYVAVPSFEMAKVVSKYAKKNNVKFIIDIQDLWPEAFKMVCNIPVLSDLIFYPLKRQADFVYKNADEIIAVSDTYANRALKVNKKVSKAVSVFLGTDLDEFDKAKKDYHILESDGLFRIAYIGTLGYSYDLKCTIDALEILKKKGITNLLFVVMGSGPLQKEFEEYAKEKNIDCEFTGRLDYEEMVGKLCSCDIAVNPITKGAAQSIINKVGDYAASGLPVINTQESLEYRKLVDDYEIGFNVENGNANGLADKIEILYNDENLRKKMGQNNRKLAEEKFDRKKTYLAIKELLEK